MSIRKYALIVTIFSFAVFFVVSCNKDSTPATTTQAVSKMDLLTNNMFIYDSVYNNWGLSTQTVVYARGAASNAQNWTNERVKLYRDGTFDEIQTTGTWRQGNWAMNSDTTVFTTSGQGYSNSVQVVTLTDTRFVWIDAANKVRGVQIPKR